MNPEDMAFQIPLCDKCRINEIITDGREWEVSYELWRNEEM